MPWIYEIGHVPGVLSMPASVTWLVAWTVPPLRRMLLTVYITQKGAKLACNQCNSHKPSEIKHDAILKNSTPVDTLRLTSLSFSVEVFGLTKSF